MDNDRTPKNAINVFVASSLSLTEYRKAIVETVEQEIPRLLSVSDVFTFKAYVYEEELQKVEPDRAQDRINRKIGQSLFFFLIVDNVVGSKTKEEFVVAYEGFKQHQNPAFISVFTKEYPDQGATAPQPQGDYIKFKEFKEKYLTAFVWNDRDHELQQDVTHYEFPFSTVDDIKKKIVQSITLWMTSPYRPLIDARRGGDFTADDLYADQARRERFHDDIYFKRSFDDELLRALDWKNDVCKVVYLYGPSLSGKTRAMLRAMHHPQLRASWFRIIKPHNHTTDVIYDDIIRVTRYIDERTNDDSNQMLYVVFDDFDKYRFDDDDFSGKNPGNAFSKLLAAVLARKYVKLFIASSQSIGRLAIPELSDDSNTAIRQLLIKDLDKRSRIEAVMYFNRVTNHVIAANTQYNSVGALFIDLKKKKEAYQSFLSVRDDTKKLYRGYLMKAIKAFSIWHRTHIGDTEGLCDFCAFLAEKEGEKFNRKHFDKALKAAANNVNNTLPGLALGADGRTLEIQEYVYRYFLDFKGKAGPADGVQAEMELVAEIMEYAAGADRPLIIDFAKMACRCEHSQEITRWMLALFNGKADCSVQIASRCMKKLAEERNLLENEAIGDGRQEMAYYYPKIFRQAIYDADDFTAAKQIYLNAKEKLRDSFLYSALVLKAATLDEIADLKNMDDHAKFGRNPLVLYKMMQKATSFDEAEQVLLDIIDNQHVDPRKRERTGEQSLKPVERLYLEAERALIDDEHLEGELFEARFNGNYLTLGLNRLFMHVSTEEELNRVLRLMRENYLYIAGAGEKQLVKNILPRPTLVQLLGNLRPGTLFAGFSRLYDGNAGRMRDYLVEELIPAVSATVACRANDERYGVSIFPNHKIVNTIATVGNAFISQFSEGGFSDAYECVFKQLVDEKNKLIYRDPYSYALLLRCQDCTMDDAMEIYQDHIRPHAASAISPLVVNVYILNELLKKVKGSNVKLLGEIDVMFDLHKVARDIYTFNMMIPAMPYKKALAYIDDKIRQGLMKPDPFTFGNLIDAAPDLHTVLGYMDVLKLDLPDGYAVNEPAGDQICKEVKANLKQIMNLQIAWVNIFKKECRYAADRQAMQSCLDFLKSDPKARILLTDGRIFNICLSNSDFIRNYREAFDFIRQCEQYAEENGWKFFDSYTLNNALNLMKGHNTGKNHDAIVKACNDLFMHGRERGVEITLREYNARLSFFKEQNEVIEWIFFPPAEDGGKSRIETVRCTPLTYVEKLVELGFDPDRYTFVNCTNVQTGMSDEGLNRLLDLCGNARFDYRTISEFSQKYALKEESPFYRRLIKAPREKRSAGEYNKAVIKQYIKNEISFDTAVERFDTSSAATATYALNIMIFTLMEKYKRGEFRPSDLFAEGWKFYTRFMMPQADGGAPKTRPNSFTFSILASMKARKEDMRAIRTEMARLNATGEYRLTESDYFLSADIATARSVAEIRAYEQRYLQSHTYLSSANADWALYRLIQPFEQEGKTDDRQTESQEEAYGYAEKTIRYLCTRDPGDAEFLRNDRTPRVLSLYYESEKNVSVQTMINMLKWHERAKTKEWEKEFIPVLFDKYPHTIDKNGTIARYIVNNIGRNDDRLLERIARLLDLVKPSAELAEFRYSLAAEIMKGRNTDAQLNRAALFGNDTNVLQLIISNAAAQLSTYSTLERVIALAIDRGLAIDEELASVLALAVVNNFHKEPRLNRVRRQIESALEAGDVQVGHFLVNKSGDNEAYDRKVSLDDNVRELFGLNYDLSHSKDFDEMVGVLTDFCKMCSGRARQRKNTSYVIPPVAARAVVAWMAWMSTKDSKSEKAWREPWRNSVLKVFDDKSQEEKVDLLELLGERGSTGTLHELKSSEQMDFRTNRKIYDIGIVNLMNDLPFETRFQIAVRLGKPSELLRSIGDCRTILGNVDTIAACEDKSVGYAFIVALETAECAEDLVRVLETLGRYAATINLKIANLVAGKAIQFAVLDCNYYRSDFGRWIVDPRKQCLSLNAIASVFGVALPTREEITLSKGMYRNVQEFIRQHDLYCALSRVTDRHTAHAAVAGYLGQEGRITHPYLVLRMLEFNDVREQLIRGLCCEEYVFNSSVLAMPGDDPSGYRFKLSAPLFDLLLDYLINARGKRQNRYHAITLFAHSVALAGANILTPESLDKVIHTIQSSRDYALFFSTVCDHELTLTAQHYERLVSKLRYLRFVRENNDASDLLKEVWSRVSTNASVDQLQSGHFCFRPCDERKFNWWMSTPVDIAWDENRSSLDQKICFNMFNLPDRYMKSLMILNKYHGRAPLPERVGQKMDQYAQEFFRTLEERPENLWTVRRIAYYWSRTAEWNRIKAGTQWKGMMLRIIVFINKLATGTIVANPRIQLTAARAMELIRYAMKWAEEQGFSSVLLSLRNFNERAIGKLALSNELGRPLEQQKTAEREEARRIGFFIGINELNAALDRKRRREPGGNDRSETEE